MENFQLFSADESKVLDWALLSVVKSIYPYLDRDHELDNDTIRIINRMRWEIFQKWYFPYKLAVELEWKRPNIPEILIGDHSVKVDRWCNI